MWCHDYLWPITTAFDYFDKIEFTSKLHVVFIMFMDLKTGFESVSGQHIKEGRSNTQHWLQQQSMINIHVFLGQRCHENLSMKPWSKSSE